MHIIIGLITAIAGLFWAINSLQRSGFSPSSLNPFLMFRRNKWKTLYAEKPIYNLDKPLDVAAVLLLGTLKCEGEISSEQKATLISIFEDHFKMENSEASDLLLASSHLIRDEIYLSDDLDKIMARSRDQFSDEQIDSVLSLMTKLSTLESPMNEAQENLITTAKDYFSKTSKSSENWR